MQHVRALSHVRRHGKPAAAVLVVAAAAVSAWWVYQLRGAGTVDLQVYRFGVEAWWSGRGMYGTLPPTSGGTSLPFVYPPFAAILFSPLAVLPWEASVVTLAAVSVLALAATLYHVAAWFGWGRTTVVAVTAMSLMGGLWLEPVSSNGRFGQINLVLMALVALDCLARQPRWPRGVLVGIAAAVKLTPAAFVLFFVLRKDYRAAATAAITGVGVSLATFLVAPRASATFWRSGGDVGSLSGEPYFTNQSLWGALARLQVPQPWLTVLLVVLGAVVVALGAVAMRGLPAPAALAANAAVALLVAPVAWTHHWVWVAPAILAMIGCGISAGVRRGSGWLVAAAVTIAVTVLAPHTWVPGAFGHEFTWSPMQHVIGDGYVLLGLVLLVAAACAACAARRPATAARETGELVGSGKR